MKAFETVSGTVAPLDRANVDTDQIIPKQFLKSIKRTGFGDNLFDGWRYLDEGMPGQTQNERRINHEFVLNAPRYQGARVLLARDNFGCGSSREHAVWSLMEYGFDAVLAPSFADIFYSNCFKNGLLPIVLSEEVIDDFFQKATGPEGLVLTVDLSAQTVVEADGTSHSFDIDPVRKRKLLHGLDDIGLTLAERGLIEQFERSHYARMPWLPGAEAGDKS